MIYTNVPLSVDTLARTLWGEARGCGRAGMYHVANVIMNRVDDPRWWGNSVVSVCLRPFQFSCRNHGDPNLTRLLAVTDTDPDFKVAIEIATQAIAGNLPDLTNGADSYYAASMKTPPAWASSAQKTFADGWHVFFRTVPKPAVRVANVSVHATTEGA